MMIRFKQVVAIGAVATVALGLAGCATEEPGSDATATPKPLSISTWMYEEPGIGDFWKNSVESLDSPAVSNVDVRNLPVAEYTKQLLIEASQGTTGDVVFLGYQSLAEINAMGALMPLDDILGDLTDRIDPRALADVTIDGKIVALPIASYNYSLIYNQDLFTEAGISGPPTSPEEFLEAARDLTKREGGQVVQYGYSMDNTADNMTYQNLLSWTTAFGGQLWDEDGATLDSPEAVKALEFMKTMYDEELIPQGKGQADVRALYANGSSAMEIDGAWQIPFIGSISPDVLAATKTAKVPWDGPALGATNITVAVSANAANPEGAADYIRSLMGEQLISTFLDHADVIPQIEGAVSDDILEKKPYLEAYVEGLKTAQSSIPPMYSDQNTAFWRIVSDAIVASLQTGVAPKDALAEAQKRVQSELD